jgi:ribokinase
MTVRAVVVGSLVTDLAFRIPRRPEGGEVIVATDFGVYLGGKGYNQAVALARLGADVAMFGAVGRDAYGEGFIAALEREGIDARGVLRLPDVPTAVAVPLITPDGDVGFVQYQGANRQLPADIGAGVPPCDVLLLQGEINPDASAAAGALVREQGGLVVLNPAPIHEVTDAMVAPAHVVVPNEVEARGLLGEDGTADGPALARLLHERGRDAVVTLGAAGAAWATSQGSGSQAPPRVHAVDATAAGDSFCAALALRLAEGAGFADAVRFACAAGAHAATRRGAEPSLPTRTDVEALLQRMA